MLLILLLMSATLYWLNLEAIWRKTKKINTHLTCFCLLNKIEQSKQKNPREGFHVMTVFCILRSMNSIENVGENKAIWVDSNQSNFHVIVLHVFWAWPIQCYYSHLNTICKVFFVLHKFPINMIFQHWHGKWYKDWSCTREASEP